MSAALIALTKDYLRRKFTAKEVIDIKTYGGEFTSAEIPFSSYKCPAMFITVLGWTPGPSGTRLTGKTVRAVQMAAFIVFHHMSREERLLGAMTLAEKVCLSLHSWRPTVNDSPHMHVVPLEMDPQAENLYGRAMDAKNQALWVVKWVQDIQPKVSAPELFDLLHVDITENYLPGVAPDTTAPGTHVVSVTDRINFQTQQEP